MIIHYITALLLSVVKVVVLVVAIAVSINVLACKAPICRLCYILSIVLFHTCKGHFFGRV